MKVRDILARKGSAIISVKPTDTITKLCSVLKEKRIGAVVVTADGKRLEGVISERDVAYGLAAGAVDIGKSTVAALMTRNVITCAATDNIAFVASTMLSRNIRHLPVKEGDKLIGMISMRDVLNMRLDELQQQTAQLRNFIVETSLEPQDR